MNPPPRSCSACGAPPPRPRGDGAAALVAMERLRPNVAFLDIRMPPPSGLDVARRAGAGTAVVFVTAYDTHAVEAFDPGGRGLSPQARARLTPAGNREPLAAVVGPWETAAGWIRGPLSR